MVHARIDNGLKYDVEQIFIQLGLSPSDAIKLFYKQVSLRGGLPFEVKLPDELRAQAILMSKLREAEDAVADGSGWMSIEESRAKLGL